MQLSITVENNDPSIGYVTVAVGGFLSANATIERAELWGFDSDDPGGTVQLFGQQIDITETGTYDIAVGGAEFFRVWGNASYPPCPPGGTRSVRGIITGLTFE